MRRLVMLGLLIILWGSLTLRPPTVQAWGYTGHRLVATLAFDHLTNKAKQEVTTLLEGGTLADAANWADEVRPQRPETETWHYVDIPLTTSSYDPERDCPKGDCIVAVIKAQKKILADKGKPRLQRQEALKYLVHFVGDLHQPLHCADNNDEGGNKLMVQFNGQPTNLHYVWDTGLIKASGYSEMEYLTRLREKIQAVNKKSLREIVEENVEDWTREIHEIGTEQVYPIPHHRVLGKDYVQEKLPLVEEQLIRGALRLAKLLNEACG
jgi:nuclease S1